LNRGAKLEQKHSKCIQDEIQGNIAETKTDTKTASAQRTALEKATEVLEGRRKGCTELLIPAVRLLSFDKINIVALSRELPSIPTLREAISAVPRMPFLTLCWIRPPPLDKSLLERTTIGSMAEAVVPKIPYLSVMAVGAPSLDRSTLSPVRTAKPQLAVAPNTPQVSVKLSAPQLDRSIYVTPLVD